MRGRRLRSGDDSGWLCCRILSWKKNRVDKRTSLKAVYLWGKSAACPSGRPHLYSLLKETVVITSNTNTVTAAARRQSVRSWCFDMRSSVYVMCGKWQRLDKIVAHLYMFVLPSHEHCVKWENKCLVPSVFILLLWTIKQFTRKKIDIVLLCFLFVLEMSTIIF